MRLVQNDEGYRVSFSDETTPDRLLNMVMFTLDSSVVNEHL